MLLLFKQDTEYQNKLFAKAGDVVEVSEENGFAARWIKRGAIVVDAPKEEVVEEEVIKEEEVLEVEELVNFDSMKKDELYEYIALHGISLPNDLSKVKAIREFLKDL